MLLRYVFFLLSLFFNETKENRKDACVCACVCVLCVCECVIEREIVHVCDKLFRKAKQQGINSITLFQNENRDQKIIQNEKASNCLV